MLWWSQDMNLWLRMSQHKNHQHGQRPHEKQILASSDEENKDNSGLASFDLEGAATGKHHNGLVVGSRVAGFQSRPASDVWSGPSALSRPASTRIYIRSAPA